MSLFRNYLLSLVRNAIRDKFFTLLNLLGLAVGITASILIFIYIQDQVTYDKHNENFERIYRLEGDFLISEKQELTALTPFPLGPTLKDDYPEIVEQVRILPRRDFYFKHGEDSFKEDSIMLADSTVFKIFSVSFVSGDPNTALVAPFSIVVSRTLAYKYFGTWDVVGKSMEALEGTTFNITGVFEDLPGNGFAEDHRNRRTGDDLPLIFPFPVQGDGKNGLEVHVPANLGVACVHVSIAEAEIEFREQRPHVRGRIAQLATNIRQASVLGAVVGDGLRLRVVCGGGPGCSSERQGREGGEQNDGQCLANGPPKNA